MYVYIYYHFMKDSACIVLYPLLRLPPVSFLSFLSQVLTSRHSFFHHPNINTILKFSYLIVVAGNSNLDTLTVCVLTCSITII